MVTSQKEYRLNMSLDRRLNGESTMSRKSKVAVVAMIMLLGGMTAFTITYVVNAFSSAEIDLVVPAITFLLGLTAMVGLTK